VKSSTTARSRKRRAPASHAAEKMRKTGSRLRDSTFRSTLGFLSDFANVGGLKPLRTLRHLKLDLVALG
jgi:hypothetical protein